MHDRELTDILDVHAPCTVPWSSLRTRGAHSAVRHCSHCELDVYDVASMSRASVKALVANARGRVCIRLTRRADGTVVTADCAEARARHRRRSTLRAAAAVVAGLPAMLGSVLAGVLSLREALTHLLGVAEVDPPPAPRAHGLVQIRPWRPTTVTAGRMDLRPRTRSWKVGGVLHARQEQEGTMLLTIATNRGWQPTPGMFLSVGPLLHQASVITVLAWKRRQVIARVTALATLPQPGDVVRVLDAK